MYQESSLLILLSIIVAEDETIDWKGCERLTNINKTSITYNKNLFLCGRKRTITMFKQIKKVKKGIPRPFKPPLGSVLDICQQKTCRRGIKL